MIDHFENDNQAEWDENLDNLVRFGHSIISEIGDIINSDQKSNLEKLVKFFYMKCRIVEDDLLSKKRTINKLANGLDTNRAESNRITEKLVKMMVESNDMLKESQQINHKLIDTINLEREEHKKFKTPSSN